MHFFNKAIWKNGHIFTSALWYTGEPVKVRLSEIDDHFVEDSNQFYNLLSSLSF